MYPSTRYLYSSTIGDDVLLLVSLLKLKHHMQIRTP